MKLSKLIILLTAISFFSSIPYAAKAKDCSNAKGFHAKLMCQLGSKKYASTTTTTTTATETPDEPKPCVTEKKTLVDLFKKKCIEE